MATNRFMCEICNIGFQGTRIYSCTGGGAKFRGRSDQGTLEISCVHHHRSRALDELPRIKKHFCRKHGEKRYKCDRCSKMYAVESDVKLSSYENLLHQGASL
ncbi:hypothetical protein ACS0TY_026942 [Phlomoides rotata]